MFQLCMASTSYHLLEQNWPSKGIIKSLDSWNHKRGLHILHLTNDFCLHVISTTWPFGRCYHKVLPGSLIFQFSMAWNKRKRPLITHVYSSYIQLTNCRSLWKAAAWPPTCKTIEYFRPRCDTRAHDLWLSTAMNVDMHELLCPGRFLIEIPVSPNPTCYILPFHKMIIWIQHKCRFDFMILQTNLVTGFTNFVGIVNKVHNIDNQFSFNFRPISLHVVINFMIWYPYLHNQLYE